MLKLLQRFHPWGWFAIALVIVLLDQLTKHIAVSALYEGERVIITSFFNITLRYNTGAAFSMFADKGDLGRYSLMILSLVVSVALLVWIAKLSVKKWVEIVGLTLVLGGAVGNLYDRIVLGKVVDFIEVHWQSTHFFPAFNIADSAICVGAAFLLFDAFFLSKDKKQTATEPK